MHVLFLHMVGTDSEPKAAAGSIDSPRAPTLPTYLFEIVQAMLVTVGDVKRVEVLQGPSLIWQPHGGYAFQDLIQFLLTRGLKTTQKAEKKISGQWYHSASTLWTTGTALEMNTCASLKTQVCHWVLLQTSPPGTQNQSRA